MTTLLTERPAAEPLQGLADIRPSSPLSPSPARVGVRTAPISSPTKATPTVFIVDDDVSIRESLELLVEAVGWRSEAFASAQAFLSQPRTSAPGCLVLDVNLPDLNGLELQSRLVDRVDTPIVFITGYGDVPMAVRAMKAGAVEFLIKPFREETLLSALRNAIDRSHAALLNAAENRALQDAYESLSRREREVMELVVLGLLNKQVGGELGISEITVKAHRGQVMRKMKARSLADLVKMAGRLRAAIDETPAASPDMDACLPAPAPAPALGLAAN